MSTDAPQQGGFTPTIKPGKLTIAEFQQFAGVVKDLLAEQPGIKYSIYAAGIAGFLQTLYLLWLFARYLHLVH